MFLRFFINFHASVTLIIPKFLSLLNVLSLDIFSRLLLRYGTIYSLLCCLYHQSVFFLFSSLFIMNLSHFYSVLAVTKFYRWFVIIIESFFVISSDNSSILVSYTHLNLVFSNSNCTSTLYNNYLYFFCV